MEHILLNDEINRLLARSNKFEWNKIFIKRVSYAVHFNTIELMEKNKDKLKEEYYAFVNRTYYDEFREKQAIGSDFYSEYQTFYEYFVQGNKEKDKVILKVLEAVTDLISLGIDYWDLHSFNVLVNKESDIKLVDLDGAKVRKAKINDVLYNFIDLIVESYFFFDLKGSVNSTMCNFGVNLYSSVCLQKYYSPKFVLLIQGVYKDISLIKDVELILKELKDEEKLEEVRNQVKRLRPYWFNSKES